MVVVGIMVIVMAMSDFVVAWWWLGFIVLIGCFVGFVYLHRRSAALRYTIDRLILKFPIVGQIIEKATIARWTRTLQTMFAAGVPLVESLDAVAGEHNNPRTLQLFGDRDQPDQVC